MIRVVGFVDLLVVLLCGYLSDCLLGVAVVLLFTIADRFCIRGFVSGFWVAFDLWF